MPGSSSFGCVCSEREMASERSWNETDDFISSLGKRLRLSLGMYGLLDCLSAAAGSLTFVAITGLVPLLSRLSDVAHHRPCRVIDSR
jgi:hypothetical protein